MALIKCPECGRDISDKAQSCPTCGYPIIGADARKKTFSVFCMDWSNSPPLINVEVKATNPEEAKTIALAALKKNGHPNANIAPEIPGSGINVVQEIIT